jgi:hypothetical protein
MRSIGFVVVEEEGVAALAAERLGGDLAQPVEHLRSAQRRDEGLADARQRRRDRGLFLFGAMQLRRAENERHLPRDADEELDVGLGEGRILGPPDRRDRAGDRAANDQRHDDGRAGAERLELRDRHVRLRIGGLPHDGAAAADRARQRWLASSGIRSAMAARPGARAPRGRAIRRARRRRSR